MDASTKDNLNEDKIKMIQTLSKIFNLNIDSNQIQLQVNNEYLDSEKKITQLKKKVEDTEKSNKEFFKKCKEKEDEYLEKIAGLEKKMTIFDKADVVNLQKQNEDYEIQIMNLNKTLQNLTLMQTQDFEKFNFLMDELTTLKESLVTELDMTQKLKSQLIELKNKKIEDSKQNSKVELIMKYNDGKKYKDNDEINEDLKENKVFKNANPASKKKTSIRKNNL